MKRGTVLLPAARCQKQVEKVQFCNLQTLNRILCKSRFDARHRQVILDDYHKRIKTVEALSEEPQISVPTFYKWKNEVETNKNEDKKRLKELEEENLRLKKMYAELQLRHEVVSEAVEILKKRGFES
jgi:putative transposase